MSERRILVVIAVDPDLGEPEGWEVVRVLGDAAEEITWASHSVLREVEVHSGDLHGVHLPAIERFSELVRKAIPAPSGGERYLVLSPVLIPLDLTVDPEGPWGNRAIFSHVFPGRDLGEPALLQRACSNRRVPLGPYTLLCPMGMERSVPRHRQDILVVASELERYIPVEILLQPNLNRAKSVLGRADIAWLHVDTHGDRYGERWMLGPTRDGGQVVAAQDSIRNVATPFVMVVGCALAAGGSSVGGVLYEQGATSVVGPCVVFRSLGTTGTEDGEAAWYRNFYGALIRGSDVGQALLEARQKNTAGRLLKFAWLIIGSSLLSFTR